MAVCQSCNGWGIVLRIGAVPPTKKEDRTKLLRLAVDRQVTLKQQVCVPCGGYGARPEV